MSKLKVIDLFAGIGGLSYGFHNLDNSFEIIAANEIDKSIAQTYCYNFPEVKIYNQDIKDLSFKKIKEDLNVNSKIDIIIGGPPCQAYSTVGKRLIDDPRGKLFQQYYRLLKEINPDFFLYENVKGLLTINKGKLFEEIIELFDSLGYRVNYKVLNALDYGVPQNRERIIIIGTKLNKKFEFPVQTHYSKDKSLISKQKLHLTLKDALSDLPLLKTSQIEENYICEPTNDYQKKMRKNIKDNSVKEHFCTKNNQNLKKIMEYLPQGGTINDLPQELKPKSGFGNTYSRLWWNKPSTTITRNFSTPSSSRCIHPLSPRPLTIREAARLQSFPDDFIFCGNNSSKKVQIGNAVPPILSEMLAKQIEKHFNYN